MKKLFLGVVTLTVLTFGLNACKSKEAPAPEATTTQVETPAPAAAPESAQQVATEITVPTFADATVTAYCEKYKTLMTEYAAAKGSTDPAKATELNKKFNDWTKEAGKLAGKIKPEEMKKFNDFFAAAAKSWQDMATAK